MARPAAVTRYPVRLDRLRLPEPLTIAVVADIHACTPFTPLAQVRAWVEQTNALGADLVLLLGDYVGNVLGARGIDAGAVCAELAALRAPMGVFAVLGNHDWRDDPGAQAARARHSVWHGALAEAGLSVLANTAVDLVHHGAPLALAGLDSQRAYQSFWHRQDRGADDWPALRAGLAPDLPTILLAHEPDIFPDLPDWVDLTICGHTHGGQIAPVGTALLVPSKYGTRYAYGAFRDGRKQMIVSGGLGFSGLPLRLGRPPELLWLEVQ